MSSETANPQDRVLSVDVLRGFDMFWLAGGTGLALGIVGLCGERAKALLLPQLDHAKWIGFTFYDFIFPLFVFVVGMSVVFSLGKLLERKGRTAAYKRIARRAVLMYMLGLVYYGGMGGGWSDIRLMGVLQRLAICYLITGLLFCHFGTRSLVAICVTILAGYWFLLSFVPAPGHETVSWEPDGTWTAFVDAHWLPGRKHEGTWDANGILGTISAVSTCLMGVFSAQLLIAGTLSAQKKAGYLIGGGLVVTVLGLLLGLQTPIIKMLWTPSYVLVSGGLSVFLLGVFHLIVDVWKIRWWTPPFLWIGANALTIYLARNFMDFNALADRFVGGGVAAMVGPDVGYLLRVVLSLAFSLAFVRYLYRKGIFLRV
ncbi:MAG: DUF5009 domain-containing protein [Candidatus Hydrogenedentes bacterium]|nr:DUF5009 domain-containing protein [Candidatus Hydrogenedentota bacterium]